MKDVARALFSASFIFSLIIPAFSYEIPEAVYPVVPETGVSAESFVPEGWTIEVVEKGDLNKDRRDDILLVLKGVDPDNMLSNDSESPGVAEWDTNPRILAVAFASKTGGYVLVLQSDDFIPRHDNPCIDDPFGGAEIVDGAIQIRFHLWANAGTWYTSDSSFTFRYRDKSFRLVSYSDYTTKRNTGETWDLALDYLSRKAEITIGNFSSNEGEGEGEGDDDSEDEYKSKTYTKRLPREPLKSLAEIGPGFDFCVEQSNLSWWGLEEAD